MLFVFFERRTNDDWTISGGKISNCHPASFLIHFTDHEVTRKSANLKGRSTHSKGTCPLLCADLTKKHELKHSQFVAQ